MLDVLDHSSADFLPTKSIPDPDAFEEWHRLGFAAVGELSHRDFGEAGNRAIGVSAMNPQVS